MSYRCMSCMGEYDHRYNVCPYCGYMKGMPPKEPHHLMPETIINKRYIVGRSVGFGGFGVTYIGWDAQLNQKVAIKEYLPSEFATRIPGTTEVSIYDGEKKTYFTEGLQSFIGEAQKLAKFNSDGIVKIYDVFSENNTAYIIMEYLDGETAAQKLKKNGPMSFDNAMRVIVPVLNALDGVHKMGIIHRDISPDNIFITNDGRVKLIDFGSARYASAYNSKSLSVIIKRGYAPPEQYVKSGEQGSWTDIYATAATLYKLITGTTPVESIDRKNYALPTPTSMGIPIPQASENAIMNALNLDPKLRPQTAEEFFKGLTKGAPRVTEKKKRNKTKFPIWLTVLCSAVGAFVVLVAVLFATGVMEFSNGRLIFNTPVADGYVRVPDVLGESKESAKTILDKKELGMLITGKKEYEDIERNLICEQTPEGGEKTEEKDTVEVKISSGPRVGYVPGVLFHTKQAAIESLEKEGFEVKVKEEHSDEIGFDGVISQSEDENTELRYGEKITVIVSKGPKEEPESAEGFEIPDYVGRNFEEVRKELLEKGIFLLIEETKYDDEIPEDVIMGQYQDEGTPLAADDVVYVTVSLGKEKVRVPDLQYLTEAEAKKAIEDAGLKAKVDYAADPTVADGIVLKQDKATGDLVLKGSEVKITVNKAEDKAEAPALTPEEAVDIFMDNKDVWMDENYYIEDWDCNMLFLDVNFDGVLELVINTISGLDFKISYNSFYEIDLSTKKIQKVNGNDRFFQNLKEGFDYVSDADYPKVFKSKKDGSCRYYCVDFQKDHFGENGQIYGFLNYRDGKLSSEYIFGEFPEAYENGRKLSDERYLDYTESSGDNGIKDTIEKEEYERKMDAFLKDNIDLNLKYKKVSKNDFESADSAKQKKLLLESYKTFGYDGSYDFDGNGEETTPKETNKNKTEKDLKVIAEKYGIVSAWEYADYDGDGTNEAFAVITDDNLKILKTVFVSSKGTSSIVEFTLDGTLYTKDEGYIRNTQGKNFFWADFGAQGSGWNTLLYSVKNGKPYKLQLSGKIQGFYEEGDLFYTTENEFLPEGGHSYPKIELLYDESSQEFRKGQKIGYE